MLAKMYRNYIPEGMRTIIYNLFLREFLSFYRAPLFSFQKVFLAHKILSYYESNKTLLSDEYALAVDFIRKNGLSTFLDNFVFKYKNIEIEVFYSDEHSMYYVFHEGKKLYFPKKYTKSQIKGYYCSLLLEQDEKSPHKYITETCFIREGDVLFDVGTAEGLFSLSQIEKVSHVYLFECDKEWVQALNVTFSLWKDKITIVETLISDVVTDNSTTLEAFVKENNIRKVDFIKMDIEGWEVVSLSASTKFLGSCKDTFISVCCYHRMSDETELKKIFTSTGFECTTSQGFMLVCDIDKKRIFAPYLRKGVIYACK